MAANYLITEPNRAEPNRPTRQNFIFKDGTLQSRNESHSHPKKKKRKRSAVCFSQSQLAFQSFLSLHQSSLFSPTAVPETQVLVVARPPLSYLPHFHKMQHLYLPLIPIHRLSRHSLSFPSFPFLQISGFFEHSLMVVYVFHFLFLGDCFVWLTFLVACFVSVGTLICSIF